MNRLKTKWSTLFLRKLWREVTPTPSEEFRYVTGIPVGDTNVPLAILPVQYRSVSVVGVDVEPLSNTRQLHLLDRHGHALTATAHSHPGRGQHSVSPSGTDYSTHRRFEQAGYSIIGLIFSRDGFLRAFSYALPFSIEVHGHGIEQLDDALFRLLPVHHHAHPARTTNQIQRATGLGHAHRRRWL